jgi:hypothetical protein
MPIVRRVFYVGKDGQEHEIGSLAELRRMLAEMTPEELRKWNDSYRWTPVTNRTGNPLYTGTLKDL